MLRRSKARLTELIDVETKCQVYMGVGCSLYVYFETCYEIIVIYFINLIYYRKWLVNDE